MPQVGQRVSEYVLVERIGGGTFGEVWKARHHVWGEQHVAVKIPTDLQYVRSLQREGVAIHGLVDPAIVRAIGFDPYGDPPYLVMEYVPGTSLRAVVARGPVAPDDACAIMGHVLNALSIAHQRGVIHRDIKPENILIHERAAAEGYAAEGVVKVTDFGLGKVATGAAMQSILVSTDGTGGAAELAGTLEYMAPEQRAGGEVDARCDLYACGVVLFELLTGARPAGTDLPSEVNPRVPRSFDEVFRRAYTRLDRRYANAGEFAAALGGVLGSGGGAPVQPPVVADSTAATAPAQCPRCNTALEKDDQFCLHCGLQVVQHVRRCPRCGAYPAGGDQFCIMCGQTLGGAGVRSMA